MVTRAKSNLTAVNALLKSLELDEPAEARAAIARTLAAKLDQLASSTSATESMAIAGIAKGLREVIEEILDSSGQEDGFVSGLFAPVGDSTDS